MLNSTGLPLMIASLLPNCSNGFKLNGPIEAANASLPKDVNAYNDNGAVVYIVAVLMFYSTGIVVMIIQYLKTEKKEIEEEISLETFFKKMPDRRREEEEKRVNKVAIRAFHTLTSFSYENDDDFDLESPIMEHPHEEQAMTLLVTDV
ncbi:uncharacterized protein LOC121375210 [Gigantopelta aegis]|uniref:uncharacterized protein LOC121375210 n=1 Tax=Gigantopelta aegis TaxID=1735272 RepID=UPI001B88CED5|nr:uncharacterized protein LOC121375210 [Gigantopelta aegis]XP_041358445.1 uncharacterized protein LOC121375210 [Gigantopelta aegis]XP_041358447.1 uncharacterized protein LOC121375210 [Gigantopelta aegis]